MKLSLRTHMLGALDPVLLAKDLGLEPDPWQEKMLRSNRRRTHTNIHRQGGKTTTTAVVGLHHALYVPGSLTLVVSPSLRQSQELFRKLLTFYRQLGRPVAPEAENVLSLALENGSRVISLPAGEATIRGYSPTLLIIDEGARVPDDVFASVLPMLSITKGRLIALSTPAGRRGWWYEASRSLRWEHYKVTGPECPRLSSAELEEERELLGDLAFRQEYMCEFVGASGAAFSGDDVDAMFSGEAPARTLAIAPPRQAARSREELRAQRQANRIIASRPRFGDPGDTPACRHGVVGRCIQCAMRGATPV